MSHRHMLHASTCYIQGVVAAMPAMPAMPPPSQCEPIKQNKPYSNHDFGFRSGFGLTDICSTQSEFTGTGSTHGLVPEPTVSVPVMRRCRSASVPPPYRLCAASAPPPCRLDARGSGVVSSCRRRRGLCLNHCTADYRQGHCTPRACS
jgi:hypothetical protein